MLKFVLHWYPISTRTMEPRWRLTHKMVKNRTFVWVYADVNVICDVCDVIYTRDHQSDKLSVGVAESGVLLQINVGIWWK